MGSKVNGKGKGLRRACIKSKVKQRQKEEKNEENKIIIHCAIGFLA